jgi:DNA-directed RNA polymerase subunit M/transcription elongation factor TFIIS
MTTKKNAISFLEKFVDSDIASEIEKGIEEFSKNYAEINDALFLLNDIYDTKLNELLNALSENDKLVLNKLDAYKLAFLQPEELYPKKYDMLLKKKEIEEYKKNDVKTSTVFKCSKCKLNKCSVTQKQTRAGDEPATTFVTCLECGYTFSFN